MNLKKEDKKLFEYLSHLRFGNVDYKNLSWQEYLLRPDSDWQFPAELDDYFKKVFFENLDIIEGKKVLDVGCEYGNKIPWFDKMNPKELICIDPTQKDIYIASYAGDLIKTPTKCIVSTAENFDLTADSIFMLGVNHHFKNQYVVYEKIKCDNLILDTWTDRNPGYGDIVNFLSKNYNLEKTKHIRKNRVIIRFKSK